MVEQNVHFLLVTLPCQSHINPLLQFAIRLIRAGAEVTFTSSVYAHRNMLKNLTHLPKGLTLATISDGYDDGFDRTQDAKNYMSTVKRRGSEGLTNLVLHLAKLGRPVTCIIHTLLLSWAAEVAHNLDIPSTLLWIQPATVFVIYHYYFHGYADLIAGNNGDPSYLIELPGLPALTCHGIPSFFLPTSSNPYAFVLDMFQEQFKVLERMRENNDDTPMRVLVNTFKDLEPEALAALDKVNLIGVGPLLPLDPSDSSFGGDVINGSKSSYIDWLDSKEESSVVYISFGTMVELGKRELEEISHALVQSGNPFLWVIRDGDNSDDKEREAMVLKLAGEQQQGLIVPWCTQVEVLNHTSVGCFVTHCGWNSTLESLMSGVPMVAFPQWTDQLTNAKLIEDVCRTGVRVKVSDDGKILESEQLKRCLEIVMSGGGKGEEMRTNAKKWKALARKAIEKEGSSDRNLCCFVEEIARCCYKDLAP